MSCKRGISQIDIILAYFCSNYRSGGREVLKYGAGCGGRVQVPRNADLKPAS